MPIEIYKVYFDMNLQLANTPWQESVAVFRVCTSSVKHHNHSRNAGFAFPVEMTLFIHWNVHARSASGH